ASTILEVRTANVAPAHSGTGSYLFVFRTRNSFSFSLSHWERVGVRGYAPSRNKGVGFLAHQALTLALSQREKESNLFSLDNWVRVYARAGIRGFCFLAH